MTSVWEHPATLPPRQIRAPLTTMTKAKRKAIAITMKWITLTSEKRTKTMYIKSLRGSTRSGET
jgi:hypothetical protein